MTSITPYKRFSPRNLEFGKPMPRGVFQFINITYNGKPLIIETPALITPNGMNADDARYWMDVELNVSSDENHQALYDMFKSTDDYCIKECIRNIGKWFKGTDEAFIEEEYKSPITAGWGNEPASLRVEVVSERPEDLIDSDGIPIQPTDVTSLSAVTVQMQLLGIWASEKYIGCHWRALAIKANLDHEKNGRRQSDSPRHISPLPRPVEKVVQPKASAQKLTQNNVGSKNTQATQSTQNTRSAKVQEMLKTLKEKNDERKKQLQSVKPVTQTQEEFDAEEYERKLEAENYSDYSDDDRRRSTDYSDDDRRRYSDYSDDDRRRYSDYSDDERRRSPVYSERSSDDRRHQEHNNYYSGRSRYH